MNRTYDEPAFEDDRCEMCGAVLAADPEPGTFAFEGFCDAECLAVQLRHNAEDTPGRPYADALRLLCEQLQTERLGR